MQKPRRSLPASYVVRVYRADPVQRGALAGLLEDLERGVTRSFRSGAELLRQLADTEDAPDSEHK